MKPGRKDKYLTNVKPYLNKIIEWCKAGASDGDIYKKLDVGSTKFYEYKKKHPELVEAMNKGRINAHEAVENALFKRAIGYDYYEQKETYIVGKDRTKKNKTIEKLIEKIKNKKHLPPEIAAIIFYLCNRMPERWSQRHNDNGNGNDLNGDVLNEDVKRSKAILAKIRTETKQGND
jgi:fatty acid-binding protein DegV